MSTDSLELIDQFAAEMKKRIGEEYHFEPFDANKPNYRQEYFNTEVTLDAVKHFVDGIGDINPLFRDRDYAKKTKYGCLQAPPAFLETINYAQHPKGVPPGVQGFLSGYQWEYFRPVCEGDSYTYRVIHPSEVEFKPSRFAGKLVIVYETGHLIRQGAEKVATYKSWVIFTPPRKTDDPGKKEIPKEMPSYTKEYIKSVYDAQDKEIPRGSKPRYWEDVKEGEDLTPVVRGPYSVSEKFAWFVGKGNPPACMSDRLSRVVEGDGAVKGIFDPKLNIYVRPNMFDSRTMGGRGVPRVHDAGAQRSAWRNMVFTNWIGDEGFLWKSKMEIRGFNQEGDVTWCKGKVTKKYIENGRCCVDINCWCENQRGEITMPGEGTVLLPSKEHGPIEYPESKIG
jgi:hypothetical protein